MRNKKGFISMSLIYTFFIILVAMLVYILATYTHNVNTLKIFKDDIINNIEGNTLGTGYGKSLQDGWDEECNLSSTKLKCRIVRNQKTLSKIRSESVENPLRFYEPYDGEGYLYYAIDNSGPVYFYRGNVTNNYIKINTRLWRILRVNGDGTIRITLDDVIFHENTYIDNLKAIYNMYYSPKSSYINPLYDSINKKSLAALNEEYQNNHSTKLFLSNFYACDSSKVNVATLSYENIFVCSDKTKMGSSIYISELEMIDVIAAGGHNTINNTNFFLNIGARPSFRTAKEYSGLYYGHTNSSSYSTAEALVLSKSHYNLYEDDYYVEMSNLGNRYLYGSDEAVAKSASYDFIRPVMVLTKDVEVTGTGTKDDPYEIVF